MPYIVSVICSVIAGLSSYIVSRRQFKADMKRLEKQYELDLEKEREKFKMEKERMELEQKHQLELKQKEFEAQAGTDLLKEFVHSPAGQALIKDAMSKKRR